MADIRIRDLPSEAAPLDTDVVPIDNGTTRSATIKNLVFSGRPTATEQEAEDGVNTEHAMTPLTTKQAINAQTPAIVLQAIDGLNLGSAAQASVSDFATAAQGLLADTSVQPARTISAGTGLTGGGTLAANRSIALNSSSIASLLLADTAVQPGDLADVATSGSYNDLVDIPAIPQGTVTSVGLSMPTGLSVTGSPVTGSGTLAGSWASGYQAYTTAEASKLAGVAPGATANQTNAYLLDRANHTGTQPASTVSGLAAVATSGAYDDLSGKPVLGTAAAQNVESFATAAQGSLADTAVQPGNLGALATKDTVTVSDISAGGTPSTTTYLRGDGTWSVGGGGGGQVDSIVEGAGIDVDDTDPVSPIVALNAASIASLGKADTSLQDAGAFVPSSKTADIDANTSARHTHANKTVLDATTASFTTALNTKLNGIATGATANTGTVTSVGIDTPTGFDSTGPITTSGNIEITYASGYQGYTTAEASKLAGIQAGAQVNTVTSVAGKTGAVTVTKADVGLSNVDNTSDANKPVSTAQATAIAAKVTRAGDSGLGFFSSVQDNLGNVGGTTIKPPMTGSNFKLMNNNGAFTLQAPDNGEYEMRILVHNASGAGALTAVGFTDPDPSWEFVTDVGAGQFIYIAVAQGAKVMNVVRAY